jgi:hypothetical protein
VIVGAVCLISTDGLLLDWRILLRCAAAAAAVKFTLKTSKNLPRVRHASVP